MRGLGGEALSLPMNEWCVKEWCVNRWRVHDWRYFAKAAWSWRQNRSLWPANDFPPILWAAFIEFRLWAVDIDD